MCERERDRCVRQEEQMWITAHSSDRSLNELPTHRVTLMIPNACFKTDRPIQCHHPPTYRSGGGDEDEHSRRQSSVQIRGRGPREPGASRNCSPVFACVTHLGGGGGGHMVGLSQVEVVEQGEGGQVGGAWRDGVFQFALHCSRPPGQFRHT